MTNCGAENAQWDSVCGLCTCVNEEINCRGLKLNQTFRSEVMSKLSNSSYKEAYFDNNYIGHLTPLPRLPFVKLSYRNNRIVKIDDRTFRALTSLEELDLSSNELTSINLSPSVFEGPFDVGFYEPLQLKILDLSGNELHTLHQDLFEHLPHLEQLYLKGNPFKILDKPTVIAISSLPNLKVLDLSFTMIKNLPPGFLHTPKKLQELVLMGNLFKEVPSDVLEESHDLKILNLNDNPIKVLSRERPFPEMPSLTQLHISYMPNLTRIEEGSLSGLTNLVYLYCRMNDQLVYISPKLFSRNDTEERWPNLVKLDISDNALKYIDHNLLMPVWTTLKHINILGNPLVCDCENQWIVTELVPLLRNISNPNNGLECAEPAAMRGQRFDALHDRNYTMRCLDAYGNHPENDGPFLISIFIIVILVLVIGLGLVMWVRNNNVCRQGGRNNYHRAFYRPTQQEDSERY
ncbi:hypothetical protein RUM43_001479 [Polyplax serrata]|uniref:LRRCT domain-containing protein n=1 Tax=Polyplax serrata TaxID=468196 RepID=A0AAN8XPU5_POLSC